MGIAEDSFTKNIYCFNAVWSDPFGTGFIWETVLSVSRIFYLKLFVAFLPAVIFGKLLNDFIDSLLGNVAVVAYMLLGGGIFLIFMDNFIKEKTELTDDEISYKSAFKIGMFQVIAMVPGVSRSAATIIGGLIQGLSRKTAAEFSFFLAVPTMFAATVYKLYEFYKSGIIFNRNKSHFWLLVMLLHLLWQSWPSVRSLVWLQNTD
jgi:undecaprenyl-diphosphatase